MEGISRKDLDRISQILSNHVNTDESIQLAKKLTEFDFIPKMYAYTYLKRFYQEIKDIKTTEIDDVPVHLDGLDLDLVTSSNLNGIKRLLQNTFGREDYFCDFDDSIFHSTRKWGKCQSDGHDEDDDIEQTLFPIYQASEDTRKIIESEEWWCRNCSDDSDGWEGDFEISCDMEIGE